MAIKYLHQLRVAAVCNCADRGPFYSDSSALTAWSDWIERTNARELASFLADVQEAQKRYDALAEERRYYDDIESGQWAEHIAAQRSTYYTKRNLL
jgi:hypothetical protein